MTICFCRKFRMFCKTAKKYEKSEQNAYIITKNLNNLENSEKNQKQLAILKTKIWPA